MAKIKIIHFIYGLSNGGVENVLLNYFSKLNLNDYSLSVVVQKASDSNCIARFEKLGFKIYNVGSKKNIIKYVNKVSKIIKNEKPDIIHCHTNYGSVVPLLIAKKLKVPRRICHSHIAIKNTKLKNYFLKPLIKYVANEYMACGKAAAINLFGQENYDNNKVFILNNAIDFNKYKYNEKERNILRGEFKVAENEILLGNIGRFVPQKNHQFLIEIFENCYQKNHKYKLLLIGTGKLKAKIKQEVINKNLENNIIFLEKRDDINKILSALDIFLMPSLFEGLPVAGLEAQAANLPCLFSDTITDESKILPSTKYLSIKDSTVWEQEIYNTKIANREQVNNKYFEQSGFDINKEAIKLDAYYRKR